VIWFLVLHAPLRTFLTALIAIIMGLTSELLAAASYNPHPQPFGLSPQGEACYPLPTTYFS
jgi:hypothetical protein